MKLTLEQILSLLRSHQGRTLKTVTEQEYVVEVKGGKVTVTPSSTGTPRSLPKNELVQALEEFNRTGSIVSTDYRGFGVNASYYLPLLHSIVSSATETPEAADIEEPSRPERVQQVVSRIVRDTALARAVKLEQEFRCQLCGTSLDLGDGRFYAEAHHVRPLGSPHDGPDERENIVCVCPNHHALLDFGAIRLDESAVPKVRPEHVRYHNDKIFGDTSRKG